MPLYFVFFFFSSRRRHTRLVSDWSSDVCSSDLGFSSPLAAIMPLDALRSGNAYDAGHSARRLRCPLLMTPIGDRGFDPKTTAANAAWRSRALQKPNAASDLHGKAQGETRQKPPQYRNT